MEVKFGFSDLENLRISTRLKMGIMSLIILIIKSEKIEKNEKKGDAGVNFRIALRKMRKRS